MNRQAGPPRKSSAGAKALLCVLAVLPVFLVWTHDPGVILLTRLYSAACLAAAMSFAVIALRRNSGPGLGVTALLAATLVLALIAGSWLS